MRPSSRGPPAATPTTSQRRLPPRRPLRRPVRVSRFSTPSHPAHFDDGRGLAPSPPADHEGEPDQTHDQDCPDGYGRDLGPLAGGIDLTFDLAELGLDVVAGDGAFDGF